MTQLKQIYKCQVCGNIVEVLHTGQGTLVCCGQPMGLQAEKTIAEEGQEKHAPVIERIDENTVKIKVGSVPHPMEEAHFIEWIELDNYKKFLQPNQLPEAEFKTNEPNPIARIYCNVHGLWRN